MENAERNLEAHDYPWDQCMSDMVEQGYDEETAAKICTAIKNRTVRGRRRIEREERARDETGLTEIGILMADIKALKAENEQLKSTVAKMLEEKHLASR